MAYRCHHGNLIHDSWMECPECRAEHEVRKAPNAARKAAREARTRKSPQQKTDGGQRTQEQQDDGVTARLRWDPSLLDAFVRRQNGSWNHEDWLGLLDQLKNAGFAPIDEARVGCLLEERRDQWRKEQ
jgi:uncharacterized Zn finger protein (UPF0148 family)